jgi:hypothetical protein
MENTNIDQDQSSQDMDPMYSPTPQDQSQFKRMTIVNNGGIINVTNRTSPKIVSVPIVKVDSKNS